MAESPAMSQTDPVRVEYRIQRASTDAHGVRVWSDLCPLPESISPEEAATEVRDLPYRRIVKVFITETFEVIP